MNAFYVNLPPSAAANMIHQYVSSNGASTTCVGSYNRMSPEGRETILLVFEKYFMRTSSRASLSVIIENLSGTTAVYSIGSGGGTGALFSFDWGAGDSFANLVTEALRGYIM